MIVFINLIIRISHDILSEDRAWKLLDELEKIFWEHTLGTIDEGNIDNSTISKEEFKISLKTRFMNIVNINYLLEKMVIPKVLFWGNLVKIYLNYLDIPMI